MSTRSNDAGKKDKGKDKDGLEESHKGDKGGISTEDKIDHIYKVLSTLMTKDDMDARLNTLREEIKREHQERMDRLESRAFDLEEENEELKQTVSSLEDRLVTAEEKIRNTEHKQNDLEQQGRKNSIRLVGIEDTNQNEPVEETVEKIVTFVKNKLNVQIEGEDIDIAHRLGSFQRNKPRNIICKFTHRRKKFDVLRERKSLKGSGCYIFEDLTKSNQLCLKKAYELDCVEHSWSVDGKLFVKLKDGRKRRLNCDTELTASFLKNDSNFKFLRD